MGLAFEWLLNAGRMQGGSAVARCSAALYAFGGKVKVPLRSY